MTDKPVSPLRQRMIEDMTVRHFKEKVQKDYIRHVTNFKDFLGRSPDTATSEDLRLFQLHMTRNHVGAPSINCAIVALRFFFKVTLERPDLVRHLTFVHEPRKLPIVLSPEEVARLLEAAPASNTRLRSASHALAAFAGAFARLVADRAATSLAVSWAGPDQPDVDASAQSGLPRGGSYGGDHQARHPAYFAAQLCNALA